MIQFGETTFYIDINSFRETVLSETNNDKQQSEVTTYYDANGAITGSEKKITKPEKDLELDSSKYDLISRMLDVVLSFPLDDMDTTLGVDRALEQTPLAFKIAFNTLLNYGIIKEK